MIERRRRLAGAVLLLSLAACGGEEKQRLSIAVEYPDPDEPAILQDLIALTQQATGGDASTSPVLRFNQPRHAGCLKADFTIPGDLPAELRTGLFAQAGSYPAWIRFANASNSPDTEKDFRGMSIKLMQVEGHKLLGTEPTLDFVLNSHPVLFVGTPEDFRDFVDDNVNSSPLLFFLNPLGPHLKELKIVRAGRQHHSSHLAIPYWSTTPYLYGEGHAVKYSARPCPNSSQPSLPDPLTDGYLREAMREQLASGGACFDFMVQFQTDAQAMPIESATVEWDEAQSPFRKVARIDIPPQAFESTEQMAFCENLAFNPWRTLPQHRPLGGINRVRKDLYQALAEFRHQRNGVNYAEPSGDESFR